MVERSYVSQGVKVTFSSKLSFAPTKAATKESSVFRKVHPGLAIVVQAAPAFLQISQWRNEDRGQDVLYGTEQTMVFTILGFCIHHHEGHLLQGQTQSEVVLCMRLKTEWLLNSCGTIVVIWTQKCQAQGIFENVHTHVMSRLFWSSDLCDIGFSDGFLWVNPGEDQAESMQSCISAICDKDLGTTSLEGLIATWTQTYVLNCEQQK